MIVCDWHISAGKSPLELIQSYTAFSGRMAPLPNWIGEGAILGLQGGTASVKESLQEIEQAAGNLNDIVGVWLQDWTGQRNFTENVGGDLPSCYMCGIGNNRKTDI